MEYVFEKTLEVAIRQYTCSFLGRNSDEITEKYCKPRVKARMNVIMKDVNNYRSDPETKIIGVPNSES